MLYYMSVVMLVIMTDDMPDRMPEFMQDIMPEDMPEDLPVTKRINVMVGMTRSKVFFRQKAITPDIPRLQTRHLLLDVHGAWLFLGRKHTQIESKSITQIL
jgi:hypothetical protein